MNVEADTDTMSGIMKITCLYHLNKSEKSYICVSLQS